VEDDDGEDDGGKDEDEEEEERVTESNMWVSLSRPRLSRMWEWKSSQSCGQNAPACDRDPYSLRARTGPCNPSLPSRGMFAAGDCGRSSSGSSENRLGPDHCLQPKSTMLIV
jgi:hypothetical protein